MFLLRRNYAGPIHPALRDGIHGDWSRHENDKAEDMENVKKKTWDRKGGRPKKDIKRDEQLAVMCTLKERKRIEYKAQTAGISMSEYLRECGLKGQVDIKIRTLPKEALLLIAAFNHNSANLNQIAKGCNRGDAFNAMEIAAILADIEENRNIAKLIKKHFE